MKKFLVPLSLCLVLFACKKDEPLAQAPNPMVASMDRMMHEMHAPKPTGNVEADYAQMMIAHHQGAVEMSKIELEKGQDPTMKAMAQKILDGQGPEIQLMQKFVNRKEVSPDAAAFQQALNQSMAVMMSPKPPVYNRIDLDFAAQMIPHHQSAVEMAKAYLRYGKDPELVKLNQNILRTQTREIQEMKQWLHTQPK